MQGYEEIFNKRGKSYQLAMEKYPLARDAEFLAIVKRLDQKPTSIVLDLPAGGGYLEKYLNPDVTYLAYDFSGEFDDNHSSIKKCKESKVNIEDETIDEIVSLAALHHIVDREAFYSEMYRVLKPGGKLIIGDALVGGKLDSFLNGFLNKWNSMGHAGRFIQDSDIEEISKAGFDVTSAKDDYMWNFENQEEAQDFFRLLFCLDLNPSNDELMEALKELGTKKANYFSVDWGLAFLECKK
ncbi:methyltransferase domain-containing protein [Ekhidna sp.]